MMIAVSCPYFRCRPYVRESVLSILRQTHTDLRLVVVNDGDPDAPWDELADIDDPRLVRFDLPTNRGPYYCHELVRRAVRAEFFAVQDADDISEPHRFERLLAVIGSHGAATSAIGGDYRGKSHEPRQRQLDTVFRHRYCHAGLHRNEALDAIGGYFGGYRVGWDSLIMNVHAMRTGVAWLDEKLYRVQYRDDSLTHAAATNSMSPERRAAREDLAAKYTRMFDARERSDFDDVVRAEMTSGEDLSAPVAALRREMAQPTPRPFIRRPRRRIVATMASLSSRERLLEQAVSSLLPQVDVLCVYLNGHMHVPPFLAHAKVAHATLSREAGWRTGEAKLMFWDREQWKAPPYWEDDDIALIVDDDIVYPQDYAQRMTAALDRHPGSIVCVHGSTLTASFERYATSRAIAAARSGLSADTQCHIPGAGTMAFRRGDFYVDLRSMMPWSHCVDVCTAIAAKAQGVPVWAIARPDGWLHPLALPPGTGVFRQRTGAGNDGAETELIQAAGPWPELVSPGFAVRQLAPVRRVRRSRQIDRSPP